MGPVEPMEVDPPALYFRFFEDDLLMPIYEGTTWMDVVALIQVLYQASVQSYGIEGGLLMEDTALTGRHVGKKIFVRMRECREINACQREGQIGWTTGLDTKKEKTRWVLSETEVEEVARERHGRVRKHLSDPWVTLF